MSDDNDEVFPGFDLDDISQGFSQLPHKWLNEMCSRIDNIAELKVVLFVFRHTCGFQEHSQYKHLTIDDFMHGRHAGNDRMDEGTGLSEMSVRNGIKKAIKHGYLVSEENRSDMARIYKSYRLKLAYFD